MSPGLKQFVFLLSRAGFGCHCFPAAGVPAIDDEPDKPLGRSFGLNRQTKERDFGFDRFETFIAMQTAYCSPIAHRMSGMSVTTVNASFSAGLARCLRRLMSRARATARVARRPKGTRAASTTPIHAAEKRTAERAKAAHALARARPTGHVFATNVKRLSAPHAPKAVAPALGRCKKLPHPKPFLKTLPIARRYAGDMPRDGVIIVVPRSE